jgi:hypothetical protein
MKITFTPEFLDFMALLGGGILYFLNGLWCGYMWGRGATKPPPKEKP